MVAPRLQAGAARWAMQLPPGREKTQVSGEDYAGFGHSMFDTRGRWANGSRAGGLGAEGQRRKVALLDQPGLPNRRAGVKGLGMLPGAPWGQREGTSGKQTVVVTEAKGGVRPRVTGCRRQGPNVSSALADVVQGQWPRPAEGTRDSVGSEGRMRARKSCANCWDRFGTRVGPTAGRRRGCPPIRMDMSRSTSISEGTTMQSRGVAISFLLRPAGL